MKDKYYTPVPEEFHIGMRYEYYDNYHGMNSSQPDEYIWRKYVLPHDVYFEGPPCPFGYYEEGQPMNSFRVKYLDQEDIEELGWKLIDQRLSEFTGKMGIYTYQINREIGFNTGSNWYLTFRTDNIRPTMTIKEETYGSWATYSYEMNFVINNFNEMRRLMTQIGIN